MAIGSRAAGQSDAGKMAILLCTYPILLNIRRGYLPVLYAIQKVVFPELGERFAERHVRMPGLEHPFDGCLAVAGDGIFAIEGDEERLRLVRDGKIR